MVVIIEYTLPHHCQYIVFYSPMSLYFALILYIVWCLARLHKNKDQQISEKDLLLAVIL